MALDPTPMHAAWDGFIDTLDRAGQRGVVADVEVPSVFGLGESQRFGDLSSDQIRQLSRFAATLGRRSDVIAVLWKDMRDKHRWQQVSEKRKARKDAESAKRRGGS